ncbi:MAG: methyltransferase domain-containing protein [Pseudomonadota bacterium]
MFDLENIRHWYQTGAGELVAHAIEKSLWDLSSCMFGYVAIELGRAIEECDLLKNCSIRQKVLIDRSDLANVYASPAALPIENDCVDLFLLPHTLDFTVKPHEILREVDRCLVPEGHVIIIGFNTISFYGLWRLFLSRKNTAPWNAEFHSLKKIRDWCSLLGFEEINLKYEAHLPPFKRIQKWKHMQSINRLMQKHLSSFGGIYIFVARKRVARITPMENSWSTRSPILASKLPKPTARVSENDRRR